MIDKKELISILEKALIAEERAIPIYMKHLKTAVFWTGAAEEDIKRIRKVMSVLLEESERHKKTVETLIDKVKSGGKDAY